MPTNTELPDTNNVPNVIAYRVGLLEKTTADLKLTVETGQEKLHTQLNDLMLHFATKTELTEKLENVQSQTHDEHERIWKEVKRLDTDVKYVQATVDDISRKNVSFSLVQKIVFAVAIAIFLAITNGMMDKLIN